MAKKNTTTTKAKTAKAESKNRPAPNAATTSATVAEGVTTPPEVPPSAPAPQTPTSGANNAKLKGRKHKSGITIVGEEPAEIAAAQAAEEGNAPAPKEKKAKAPKEPKAPKPPKVKRLSALDAAAQVLAGSKVPMRAKEMIAEMEAKGLWKSPGGKTPSATLYAAIIREISAKASEARFKKVDRGMFESAGPKEA